AGRIPCCALHYNRNTVGPVPLVHYLLVVFFLLRRCTPDSRFDTILGHVRALGILYSEPELWVVVGVGTALLDGYRNLLSNAGKSLGHAVKARKHLVLPFLEYPAHNVFRMGKT